MSTEQDDAVDFDLDALAPTPKRVRVGGQVYKLPGDMPLELFVKVNSFDARLKAGESEASIFEEVYDEVLALFQEHQPDMDELPRGVGLSGLFSLVVGTYSTPNAEPEQSAEGNAPARGQKKTRPRAARGRAAAKA